MASSKPNYLPKASSLNASTLGVMASTNEVWRDINIQYVTSVKVETISVILEYSLEQLGTEWLGGEKSVCSTKQEMVRTFLTVFLFFMFSLTIKKSGTVVV